MESCKTCVLHLLQGTGHERDVVHRNSKMGKHLGQGILYKDAKEKFMKNVTVEGAQLALEIGPILLKELKKNEYPLMFNILETICNNKKLSINW